MELRRAAQEVKSGRPVPHECRPLKSAVNQTKTERVIITTIDHAHWDEAYRWLAEGDPEAVAINMGRAATDTDTFDLIYITDAKGTPLYAFESGAAGSDLSLVEPKAVSDLVDVITRFPLEPYIARTTIARSRNGLAVLAAARIQLRDVSGLSVGDVKIMIGGLYLNDHMLKHHGEQLAMDEIHAHPPNYVVAANEDYFDLTDINGQIVGRLTWITPTPGYDMLLDAMPVALSISALMLAVCYSIARTSSGQAAELLREATVARTDKLTGLLNRSGLEEVAQSPRILSAISEGQAALLYLDLNKFKTLNDTYGHDSGDRALQITADRLRSAVRHTDFVARLGGDEFVCLIIDKENPAVAADVVASRIIKEAQSSFVIGDTVHFARTSVGMAVAERGLSWHGLVARADVAMYRAKTSGRPQPVRYFDGMKGGRSSDAGLAEAA